MSLWKPSINLLARSLCMFPGLFLTAGLCAAQAVVPAPAEGADTNSGEQSSAESNTKTRTSNELAVNTEGLKPGCFYARDVGNWEVLNRDYLMVYAPSKSRPYLVRFSPSSRELRSASTIGFTGRDRICGKPGERLVITRSQGMNYSILNVWRLDAAAAERLQERKKARDSGKTEPAAESPGAVVETSIENTGEGENAETAAKPVQD